MRKSLMQAFSFMATALLVATSFSAVLAQTRRAMTGMAPADILRVANVGDAQISPNGQWVVYTVSTVDGDRTLSTLYLVRADVDLTPTSNIIQQKPSARMPVEPTAWPETQSTARPLLPSAWNGSTPRWSPDSTQIAFLATRASLPCIWVVNIGRPEPTPVPQCVAMVEDTNFFITYAGESFSWSPDSKRIAYISATEERSEARDSSDPGDPRVIDRLQYKSRTSFSDNQRTHVWITNVDKPEPRQLTSGPYYDHAITFNPRGDEIAFLSNHEADPDANNNSDIFAVDLHGEVRQITQTSGCEYEPTWSPDGKWIAYTATKRDITTIDSVAEDAHVWVTDAAGGNRRELTADQDRRARNPKWSADSRDIFYTANDRGSIFIYKTFSTHEPKRIFPHAVFGGQRSTEGSFIDNEKFQVTSFSVATRGAVGSYIAFTVAGPVEPSEVWVTNSSGIFGALIRRLSTNNDALVASRDFIAPQELPFKSFDGTQIQGWLMKPVGWREDRKYPLILSIHGGPHGMYGWAFNSAFQVYAARGYAVLYLNPRGSTGYGQKFSDGTLSEWGGGDYKDLMAGVDEALRRYPWIDQDRMGVTGGSYGGFMTNWIITQTLRFKAAVSNASVSNLISFYSTSLYQDLIHAEFGGFPWDNYDLLWQWSPLRYVKQAQTPTLFIHGEQDNDVHITQAEEMYMALKRRGVDTVLLRYPREGHGLREPKHRVDALERTIAWFDRFLK